MESDNMNEAGGAWPAGEDPRHADSRSADDYPVTEEIPTVGEEQPASFDAECQRLVDGYQALAQDCQTAMDDVHKELAQVDEGVAYLRDLFARRLADDKQKNALIAKLGEGATYAWVEPFIHDLILLLDRLEQKPDDEFDVSVYEELYDILNRRGVERIAVSSGDAFNPKVHKAVKAVESPDVDRLSVVELVRNGYILSGRVIRYAEVVVLRPAARRRPVPPDSVNSASQAAAGPAMDGVKSEADASASKGER